MIGTINDDHDDDEDAAETQQQPDAKYVERKREGRERVTSDAVMENDDQRASEREVERQERWFMVSQLTLLPVMKPDPHFCAFGSFHKTHLKPFVLFCNTTKLV